MFEWDDSSAANRFRLFQARNFINHLEVVVIVESESGKEEKTTKAFHSVRLTVGDRERTYCSVETIAENDDYHAQVVEQALKELKYWRQRYDDYKSYSQLANVFRAIDRLPAKRKRKKRRRALATP